MIQETLAEITKLEKELKEHPMCFSYSDDGDCLIVCFPNKVAGIGGAYSKKAEGKTKALKKLLEACEDAWKADCPALYPNYVSKFF